MTNNLDEFDQPELESNGEAAPAGGMRSNLSHAWRTRPLFKFLVLVIAVGAITAVSINLFSSKPIGDVSKLPSPPQGFTAPPGGSNSPYYKHETEMANDDRVKTAIKTGGSAIITPNGESKSIDEMTNPENTKKDLLVEIRNQIQQQKQEIAQIKQQAQQQPAAPQKPPEQFDESLAQAMQKEMQKLTGEWDPHGITQVAVTKESLGDDDKKSSTGASAQQDMAVGATTSSLPSQRLPTFHAPIISAGTVSYAQLLTEANSDVPGPILAQIVSGPLSGARAVGEFKVETDYLVLKFSIASLKGKDYSINAIALDPDTTLGGMATEVDERYFSRVLLPAAAGFIQGFGSALGQGSSSVVSTGDTTIVQQSGKGLQQGMFQGLAQAGQTAGQFFENQANQIKPLVRVAAGTPMGFFFITSVCTFSGCSDQSPPGGMPQPGMPGYLGGYQGYPGYGAPATGYGNYGSIPRTYPGMPTNYEGQTPFGGGGSMNPYPNAAMPYNGNALTTPTIGTPYYGTGSSLPNPYGGLGTPLINP